MKYLIVGLGNIGAEYQGTRHNIGFTILDAFAKASNISFTTQRYGDVAQMRLKNKQLVLLKPSTYMNLSGEAVRYWMQKENISLENVLIMSTTLALPFGVNSSQRKGCRRWTQWFEKHRPMRAVVQLYPTPVWCRFGFPKGMQVDYVLGHPSDEDLQILPERTEVAIEAIKAFCLSGLSFAMTNFNNK